MKIDRLKFKSAAMVLAIMLVGRAAFGTQNPLASVTAERFIDKSPEIRLEACSQGGKDVCNIHDGDYLVYKSFDFDSGVAGFKAKVAAPNKGSIEIRFDSPTGPVIGQCPFESTGGWQDWHEVTCKVDNSQAGVRDVYLIFHGATNRAVVNLHSFAFLKTIVVSNEPIVAAWPERVDAVDDEPQASGAWGMPAAGFTDNFEQGDLGRDRHARGRESFWRVFRGKPGNQSQFCFHPAGLHQ